MLVIYHPQLEEPPIDKECTLTFSVIRSGGLTQAVTISAGVNRHITEEDWQQIEKFKFAKRLIKIGALKTREAEETTEDSANAIGTTAEEINKTDDLEEFKVPEAIEIINATHDIDVLKRWYAKTERITIRNEITSRLKAIEEARA